MEARLPQLVPVAGGVYRSSLETGSPHGGYRLGGLHGLQCLGYCCALMLVLFVGGVMNPWCIALVTLFVLLQKLAPFGAWGDIPEARTHSQINCPTGAHNSPPEFFRLRHP